MSRKQFMVTVDHITTKHAAAEDSAIGAWTRLCAYCSPRLAAGRVVGAQRWSETAALRATGVARSAMDALVEAGLAVWEGADLVLDGYDHDGETIWKRKSQGGKDGNRVARSHGRTPPATPERESSRESSVDSQLGDVAALQEGIPERIPRGDCESDSESDCEEAGGSRARDPDPTPAPPDLESSPIDPTEEPHMGPLRKHGCRFDTEALRAEWKRDTKGLTPEQVDQIITQHPTPIVYPGEFRPARVAWQARTGWKSPDLAAEQARAEQAGREREERVLAERQKRAQAARVLEARQVSSREGAALLAVIDADVERWILSMSPAAKAALDKVRTAVATNNAPGLYLAIIWRDHPELRALVPVDAPAAQGGAA